MERKVSLDDKSSETIEMLADVFDDLQTALEPIRDKALDERARLVGYAQCAEQMIKIIADQVAGLRELAKKKMAAPTAELVPKRPDGNPTTASASFAMGQEKPTAVQPASKNGTPKNGRTRMKTLKEVTRGGDNSA